MIQKWTAFLPPLYLTIIPYDDSDTTDQFSITQPILRVISIYS